MARVILRNYDFPTEEKVVQAKVIRTVEIRQAFLDMDYYEEHFPNITVLVGTDKEVLDKIDEATMEKNGENLDEYVERLNITFRSFGVPYEAKIVEVLVRS